ncbi:MAG: Type 1 glutamine amidotransferase-like domain-containing protein [Cardiobacteriaceae bacterium]|nr:Type 1 glutamine amidotransferase-like domain-containing protein [Cardiobacteriaceae bacterium]
MKTLFLAASFADVAPHFPAFIGEPPAGKSVAFIPTACDVEDITFFMDDDRNAFKTLGIRVDELNLSAMSHAELAQKIAANDFIFIGGGNTFYLLQELKRSGLDSVIKEAVTNGKPYIATSAGSMVVAPDIAYGAAMDAPEKAPQLESTKAMHLVDFYLLPHYGNPPFSRVTRAIHAQYRDQIDIRPVSNAQFISVRGDEIHEHP